jgi:hypothetical protein
MNARAWLVSSFKSRRESGLPLPWKDAAISVGAFLFGVLTLAIPAYAFLVFNDHMKHVVKTGDEGYWLWCGWSLLKGLVPYRDFMEFKPPMVFVTYALALKLHGYENYGFRQLFTYFPLASILVFQLSLFSRRVDKVLAMGLSLALIQIWVMAAFHDLGLGDTESIGLAYYFFGVACLLARTPFPAFMQVLGAAFLFCCSQSKEPYLPCVVMTWAACFFASDRRGTFREDGLRYAKWTGLGALIVAIALCIYMVPSGAMTAYIKMVRRYAVVYRDPAKSFCAVGGAFEPTTALNDIHRQWTAVSKNYLTMPVMGLTIPFAVASVAYLPRRSLPLLVTTVLTCVAGFLAVTASNCPWVHYYNMLLGGLFFAFAMGLDAMAPYFEATTRPTRWLIRAAMFTGIFLVLWPRYESEAEAFGTRTYGTTAIETVPGSLALIAQHSNPDDRIVSDGNPIIYVVSNRVSGVRESNLLDPILNFYEGDTDEEKLRVVYDEMVKSRPKIIILDPDHGDAKVRHIASLWNPFLTDFKYTKLSDNVYLRPD